MNPRAEWNQYVDSRVGITRAGSAASPQSLCREPPLLEPLIGADRTRCCMRTSRGFVYSQSGHYNTNFNVRTRCCGKNQSKSKLCYDQRSVVRSVLVSSTHLGLKTRVFLSLTFMGLLMWGALSNERVVLSFIMYNVQYYNFTCYDMNAYTIYTRLLSVHAQYSRLCPIFCSFRLWILVVILLQEI
jgi:hypothetical protein